MRQHAFYVRHRCEAQLHPFIGQEAAAAASDYLRLFALVTLGSTWAQIVNTAYAALETTREKQFYEAKIATARFYMQRLLPQASSLATAIMSGSRPIMEPDANAF